jgi:hypothetical protein
MESVFPVNPIVDEAEVKDCVSRLGSDEEATAFLYSLAAVTINLVRVEDKGSVVEVQELISKAIDMRSPINLAFQPSVLKTVTDIFLQICLFGLQKPELGFFYLREAISMLHMLHIDNAEEMASLPPVERARRQRLYWQCFVHERFAALAIYKPTALLPLPSGLPDRDPSLPISIQQGWNAIIETFLLVDTEFVAYWIGDCSSCTCEWIELKHRALDDDTWQTNVSALSAMQQADLVVTRQWLRTLTWQIAMSNMLLSSKAKDDALSLSLPLRLSSQLRHFIERLSHTSLGVHGSGILNKLFDITDAILDVVIHLPRQSELAPTRERVDDVLFLKRFLFSFPRVEDLHKRILNEKLSKISELYPEIAEDVQTEIPPIVV